MMVLAIPVGYCGVLLTEYQKRKRFAPRFIWSLINKANCGMVLPRMPVTFTMPSMPLTGISKPLGGLGFLSTVCFFFIERFFFIVGGATMRFLLRGFLTLGLLLAFFFIAGVGLLWLTGVFYFFV